MTGSELPATVAVGAGRWGANVVATLSELGALVGIAESDPDRREELADEYPDVPLYEDHHAALKADAGAVAIATPAQTHHAVARDALLSGKDVYVEKPLTLSSEEAEDLVHLADDHERILMVGHLLLYQPAIEWMKSYLERGELGTVHSLHQERSKLGTVRRVENVLWSFGVHDLAVFLHLLDESPSRVKAAGQRVLQDDVEDDVHVHLNFPSGAHAHLHVSWLWPETERRLVVVGDQGMIVYDELAQKITRYNRTVDERLEAHDAGEEIVFEGGGEPLRTELMHFLECVKDRATPRSDGRQGAEVVRILERASEAMEAGHGR